MKKIISTIMFLCVIMGVMLTAASCGGDGTGNNQSSQSSAVDSSAPTNASNGTTDEKPNVDSTATQSSTTDNSNTDSSVPNSGTDGSSTDSSVPNSGNDGSSTDSSNTEGSGTGSTGGSNINPDNPPDDKPVTLTYTINVVDAFGNIPSGSVIVKLSKGEEVVKETVMRQGKAVFQLEAGEYTFEVMPMEGEFYYNKKSCVLTKDSTETTVTIYDYADESKKEEIYVYDTDGLTHIPYNAVFVEEGATYVTIDRPANTYFLFTPTRGGIYRVSYEAPRAMTLGYYGSPHNVLLDCPIDVVDGAFELEIKNEGVNIGNPGGTTQVVIGIRSFTEKGCVLKIERIGNATVDLPWDNVQANKGAIKVENYLNSEFVDFDVTDKNLTVVFNENDGYYHLNTVDGPLVYVRISSAVIESTTSTETIYKYLPAFTEMCATGRLCKVFYDEDGKVILKESYNDMLYQYAELCGANGMYPLNEQLAQAIKNIGEHNGWYDLNGELHIFGDNASSVYAENAWLFACAYENQKVFGTNEKPVVVTASSESEIKTDAILLEKDVVVTLRNSGKATLTINNADGIKVVANDGTEYVADSETGAISAVISANQNFTIVYTGQEAETVVYFTFVEYFG